jgi:hypothetical protein
VKAAILHLDNALLDQSRLRQAVYAGGGRVMHYRDLGPELRLWSRPEGLERLRRRLACAMPPTFGPALVFSGSGDFHHITPLLLERAITAVGGPRVTVLHFDNHPDWVRFDAGVHCGSWVGQAARLPKVAKVITIGVCSRDINRADPKTTDLEIIADGRMEIYAWRPNPILSLCGRAWPTIEAMGEAAFAGYLPQRIETEAVYVTIDKDLLSPGEAGTNWDQGRTSVAFLHDLIAGAVAGRQLIGADVVGDWSAADYGGRLLDGLLKRGEAILDQPWRPPSADAIAANEAINLGLLQQIRGAAQ